MNLKNKKILLISAKFFGYENDILAELISREAVVDSVLDRPFNSAFMKAVTKIAPSFTQFLVYLYYQLYFGHIFKKNYDYVFVVEGITLSRLALKRFKKYNPDCHFILYVWDSIANRPHIYDNRDCYHRVFSFDPTDSQSMGLTFRPLFFTQEFERPSDVKIQNDVNFVGTVHSDRYEVIKALCDSLDARFKKFIFLYIHAHWFFLLKKFTKKSYKNASESDFKFRPISKNEVSNIIKASLATLDIEHPNQVGLTMRTFEVMGARRKLVTTNASIKEYDFYNPANIWIVDRKNPGIPEAFFSSPYDDLSNELYEKYKLSGWIDEIFRP